MEKLLEKLEASLLMLECIWRVKDIERAYDILEEFWKRGGMENLEEVKKLAEKIDEVLKGGET
jgi:hypothetical protein